MSTETPAMRATPTALQGIDAIRLERDGAVAVVAQQGAQLLSWIARDRRERLFLSQRARHGAGSAIRGGMPVIFPQFSERGPLQRHGFARGVDWRFDGIDGDGASFSLGDGDATARWPHRFVARMRFAFDHARLAATFTVENTGDTAFAFTAALHTYLRVDDPAGVTLEGLQGCDYEDSAAGGTLHRQHDFAVGFTGEIDRIYGDVVAPLRLVDGERTVPIEQHGFADVVVWNPGARLAAGIPDLAPDDHQRFACVEAAQVLQAVVLAPQEMWSGTQLLG